MLYPLLWMLSSSFKPDFYIFKELGLWPKHFTLENYINGWRGVYGITFRTFFTNTFIIVAFCVLGRLIACSMVAYAFARLNFDFKKIFFAVMMGMVLIPIHVRLIPQYIIFWKLGWVGTYLPLIVPMFFSTDTFFIFLLVQFIRGIPSQLDEAATLDGCGAIRIYWYIILPLIWPALATVTVFTIVWIWNDFLSQLIYISDPKLFTIALGLRAFLDATDLSAYGQLFAMSVLSLLPLLIMFIFLQRFFIQGISTTGSKR